MGSYENLLIVMVEFISSSQGILLSIPSQFLMNQRLQRLLVQLVTCDNCKVCAHLSFDIDQSSESDSEDYFIEHESSQGFDALLCAMFVFMSDEEVNEDME
jgi:hypothetical protein